MDTLLFLAILGTLVLVLRGASRRLVIAAFLVCLVAALLVFDHHVTSSLNLEF